MQTFPIERSLSHTNRYFTLYSFVLKLQWVQLQLSTIFGDHPEKLPVWIGWIVILDIKCKYGHGDYRHVLRQWHWHLSLYIPTYVLYIYVRSTHIHTYIHMYARTCSLAMWSSLFLALSGLENKMMNYTWSKYCTNIYIIYVPYYV